MDPFSVGIVIPALNEASSIAAVIRAVQRFGVVIVVDDGSTDGTGSLAEDSGGRVVRHGFTKGYDAALESGFRAAQKIGCKIVITIDADGQHVPEFIQGFIEQIEGGADVVIGIRDYRQRIAEHLFSWYTYCRHGIVDPLCGMKAYKMSVFLERGYFDSSQSIGTELMLFAAKSGLLLSQVAIKVRQREGKSRFGRSFSANFRILRALVLALRGG